MTADPDNVIHQLVVGGDATVAEIIDRAHTPDDVTTHRTRARWYTTKTEPSYDDMTVKLRRVIIAARFRSPCPEQATPQETRAVLAAWAAAGT